MVTVGATLSGRFLLDRKLEDGALGETYIASDLQADGFAVRIAVVRPEISEDAAALALLREDIYRTQTLSHPSIASVYSLNSDGSTVYVVIENLDGKPLDRLINEEFGRGMPFTDARPIIEDVCAALTYLHDHGVVHTDLKPSSIFVTTGGITKLLDCGIWRAARGRLVSLRLGALTPAYASCEMFEAHVPDPRDDVYSLACIIYELLSGKHPFDNHTAIEARNEALSVAPLSTLSRSQNAALVKALTLERGRRTDSLQVLLAGLVDGHADRDRGEPRTSAAPFRPVSAGGAHQDATAERRPPQPIERGLLESIDIAAPNGTARIELHCGDLTAMAPSEAVDALVISTYPGGCTPVENSMIAALEHRGISVAGLAKNKEVDLCSAFSCWLSRRIPTDIPGIQFQRILCFEPLYRWSSTPEAVGDIFRALAPFAGGNPRISSIAMPIIAARSQAYSVREILTPLLKSAIEWLSVGLPLHVIKIFAADPSRALAARTLFQETKALLGQRPPAKPIERRYDAFISYAREDGDAANAIATALKNQKLSVFLDRLELDHGTSWQQHIFEALDQTKRLVAIYSPDYVQSKVCQEEFNIAWARGRKMSSNILFPVYWKTGNLPTYMEILNYADCREQSRSKLEGACDALTETLKIPN